MGPVQIVDINWNGSVYSCTVHLLQICRFYWAALEKDKFSGLKNGIPHIVAFSAMASPGFVVKLGCEETGDEMPIKIVWAQSTTYKNSVQDLCLITVV